MAIMDLYALYTLWWDMGAGKDAYGHEQGNIHNHKRVERVNHYFSEALAKISDILLKECRVAVADEAEYVFEKHLLPGKAVFEWIMNREERLLPKLGKVYEEGGAVAWFKHMSYEDTMTIFSAPFWEEYNELYGGKNWLKITQAVRDLDATIRRGKDKDLMFAVDKLLDLEHNTGSISSKLDKIKVSKNTLDLRAGFRSVQEFRPYVSPQVAALIPVK
jgi:hypothetical protein